MAYRATGVWILSVLILYYVFLSIVVAYYKQRSYVIEYVSIQLNACKSCILHPT